MSSIKEKYASNIVAQYDFRKGSLLDQSGNGWNATRIDSPSFGTCQRGRVLRTNINNEGLTLGKILGTSSTIANLTVVASVIPTKLNSINRIVKKYAGGGSDAGSIDLDYQATGVARFLCATSGSVFKISASPASTVKVGQLTVIGGVFNGTAQTVQVFTNGIANTAAAFTESVIPALDLDWIAFSEAANSGLADCLQILVFNTALTNEEMAQLHEEIQAEAHYDRVDIQELDNTYDAYDATGDDILDVYITDGKGWNESFANETSGDLSNTGFQISTGTWQVDSTSTGKYINNIGAGIIYRKNTQAYGTWEFDFNKTAAGAINLVMIASAVGGATATGQNGYLLMLTAAENVQLWTTTGGVVGAQLMSSSNSSFTASAWHTFKMTRSPAGVFSLYIDGVLLDAALGGLNPTDPENTHITSAYLNIDPDAGDLVRNFNFKPYI